MGDKAIITEILEASHLTDAYHDLAAHSLLDELVKHGKKRPGEGEERAGGAVAEGATVKYDRFQDDQVPTPQDKVQFGATAERTHEAPPIQDGLIIMEDIGPFRLSEEEDDESAVSDDDDSGLFPLLPSTSAGPSGAKVHSKKIRGARVDDYFLQGDLGDTFTVDRAVDALGFGKFQIKLSILTGIAWMADAMEMMILSILSPALHCDWWIEKWQQALITTVVFCGMMLSSTMWGNFTDTYGRKTTLLICTSLTFYFGLLSAVAPNFIWLLILRGLVGFGIGGLPQTVTLYAEFLPSTHRAKCVILIEIFWAIGTCFEVAIALFVMPTLGWRWLLAFSALPLFIFLLCCYWLPESARFHVACGQSDLAIATLKRVAEENGKPMLLGKLVESHHGQEVKRGRIVDLFVPEWRDTTMLLWFIWLANAFSYYGIVLFTTELYESGDECTGGEPGSSKHAEALCPLECHRLDTGDYVDLLWTTLAEFPGLIITIVIIEWLGRKKTMAIEFGVFSFFIFLLFLCLNRTWVTAFISLARMFISGAFQAAYVYTPEVYPTTIRAIGLGSCSGFARLGAILTPFVAQVASHYSVNIPVGIYGVTTVVAVIVSLLLPIETKGRSMKDTHH